MTLTTDEPLFYIEVSNANNTSELERMNINSSILKAEMYSPQNEILPITWNSNSVSNQEIVFGTLIPNPFVQQTDLNVNLLEDGEIVYSIHDLEGREIYIQSAYGHKGQNTITIKRSHGVIF